MTIPPIVATLSPRWHDVPRALRHSWSGLGNIDQFRWLARADVQAQLRLARDEIGLRYVRAAGMYGPEQRVWARRLRDWKAAEADAPKVANWQFLDLGIEALLDNGLKPVYTTCFCPGLPGDFTASPATCWPDRNAIGMPRDLSAWASFVADGLRHQVTRYGLEEVRSWYVECWNEPNLRGFFDGNREDFLKLWSATWRAVKSVHADIRIGGPSTARGEWLAEFLDWCDRDKTRPDYLATHVYNNDSESAPLSPFDGAAADRVKDSPNFAAGVIRGARTLLDARGWSGEVHWNEWGRSWFPYAPARDDVQEAAFIVKTMSEVGHTASRFAYWCLSDIYDQAGRSESEFDGNYGMLSLHGLRKPSWMAHRLLCMLGSREIHVEGGDSTVGATATVDGATRILVWRHPMNADAPQAWGRVVVRLAGEPTQALRMWRLGSTDNNILAAWRGYGSPAYPTPPQLADLRRANVLTEQPVLTVKDALGWAALVDLEQAGVALVHDS
ncbi:MAG: hypothetical protein H0X38_03000 [Planctomycetes bacterium]|nr:hypothetical protein [Planctomycetota bacterium]